MGNTNKKVSIFSVYAHFLSYIIDLCYQFVNTKIANGKCLELMFVCFVDSIQSLQ